MTGKPMDRWVPGEPSIDHVLAEFLAEQSRRLKPRTLGKYESVISRLRSHLNGYGHESLARDEAALRSRPGSNLGHRRRARAAVGTASL
jgi:hypothetical protein